MNRKTAPQPAPAPQPVRVVAIMNQKGGVGKTTVTMALALAAREAGFRVCVLDLDPQASAALWVRQRSQITGVSDPGFDVRATSARAEIVEAEIERAAGQGVEWVFLDTAPSVAGISVELVRLADVVLVPVGDGRFDLTATAPTLDLVRAGGRRPIVVFNRLPTNAKRALADLKDGFRTVMKDIVFGPVLAARAEIKHAQGALSSIVEFKPKSRAADEVMALWSYVQACFRAHAAQPAGKEAAHV